LRPLRNNMSEIELVCGRDPLRDEARKSLAAAGSARKPLGVPLEILQELLPVAVCRRQ